MRKYGFDERAQRQQWHTADGGIQYASFVGPLTCPTAAAIGTAAGTTYTGLQSTPGGNPGTVVCQYAANGATALLVSLYPSGTSLQTITAIVPAPTTPISGLGDSAAYYGTEVYVSNSASPTFSVIDPSGVLTLTQVEAVAHAVLGS